MPGIEAIVMTPISPFALSQRPIVLEGNRSVSIKVCSAQQPIVAVDGQIHYDLEFHDTVEIKKYSVKFLLVDLPGQNHYRTLRNKLHWGVNPRQNVLPETP